MLFRVQGIAIPDKNFVRMEYRIKVHCFPILNFSQLNMAGLFGLFFLFVLTKGKRGKPQSGHCRDSK